MCKFLKIQNLKCKQLKVASHLALHHVFTCLVTEDFRKRSTYGYPLEDHLVVTNREIASPIEACIVLLKEYAQREEVERLNKITFGSFQTSFFREFFVLLVQPQNYGNVAQFWMQEKWI